MCTIILFYDVCSGVHYRALQILQGDSKYDKPVSHYVLYEEWSIVLRSSLRETT